VKLSHAQISFKSSGTPVADDFSDVYFLDAHGCAETDYVFIEQNNLVNRWLQFELSDCPADNVFVIAETGFGSGLNFFQTLHHYSQLLKQGQTLPRLHFLSTEKFPMSMADLHQSIAVYPHLATWVDELLPQYPMALVGCHRMHLCNGLVTLDLWLGDIHDTLPQWLNEHDGIVDAWFLDGFAPSRNPDMWNDALFTQLARLSKPNGTLSTFTAASMVKRGLVKAGYTLTKTKGFRYKREMIRATFTDEATRQATQQQYSIPYYARPAQPLLQHVTILGGGIAAGSLAYLLTKQGIQVTVHCQDEALAQGASGNDLGGFYPQLNAQASIASQVHAGSFVYARRFYDALLRQGAEFGHAWCGVLQVGFNDKVQQRQQNLIEQEVWPAALIQGVSASQASDIAQVALPYPALLIEQGGWISPPQLVKAMFALAQQTGLCQIHTQSSLSTADITNITRDPSQAVIYATGAESARLPNPPLPYRLVRGQVERAPATPQSSALHTVLCHKGYFTPAVDGIHALGSTYVKDDISCEYRDTEAQLNLTMHQQSLVECPWIQAMPLPTSGRAAIRCSTPDHLPLVGALPDVQQQLIDFNQLYQAKPAHTYPQAKNIQGQYVLTGLGSRGLTTAPLMAQLLVSQLLGLPIPVTQTVANALNPNRFLIRDGIRRLDYLARFTDSFPGQ
jgi:tRNA 5-methylaminomethyl-2-thiouridine biosynthesis bifunctional protein